MVKVFKSDKARAEVLRGYDALLERWDVAAERINVQGRYGTTAVLRFGKRDGQKLVLFHGVGDNSALMWVFNAKALGEVFDVYAIDTIGGPGYSEPNECYTADFQDTIWLEETFDKLDLPKEGLLVAGTSCGAYFTQLCTATWPQRVLRSVSMAGGPAFVLDGEDAAKRKKSSALVMMKVFLPEALFPTKNNTKKLLKKMSGSNCTLFIDDPLLFEENWAMLRGFNQMAMNCHKVSHLFAGEERRAVTEKTLFLVGDDDPFEKLGGMKVLLASGVKYKVFSGVGHGINHEIAPKINAILVQYLANGVLPE